LENFVAVEGEENEVNTKYEIFILGFFGVPHPATFIFVYVYVIASIAYNHPVNGAGVQTHDLLSRLP
jgi:hypothetical protein